MSEVATTQGRKFVFGFGLENSAGVAVTPTLFPSMIEGTCPVNYNKQDIPGLSGTRSHPYQNMVMGQIDGRLTGRFMARKQWLQHFLYWTMGGGNTTNPTLAETVKTFTAEVDTYVRVLTFAGCKVSKLELSSEPNKPLYVNLAEVLAMSVADAAQGSGTTPVRTITDPAIMHHHLTLSLDGDVKCGTFNLTFDNKCEDNHFQNSQSRLAIPEGDREITGKVQIDWSVLNAVTRGIWTKFKSGATAAMSAVFADGTNTLTITMPRVIYHEGDAPPAASARETIYSEVPFKAMGSTPGSADEMTVAWS